jgi:oligoribonuclease
MGNYAFTDTTVTAWVDIETTGLDIDTDHILEVGVILARGFDMDEIARTSILTKPAGAPVGNTLSQLDSVALRMHEKSGLIEAITGGEHVVYSYLEADDILASFMSEHLGADPSTRPRMAGSSITFDRMFLMSRLPEFYRRLHHRSDDLTSVTHYLSGLVGSELPSLPGIDEAAHRSLDDLDRDIAYWREHAAHVKRILATTD